MQTTTQCVSNHPSVILFHDGGSGTSNGAGFLVDKERGWIITNAHVSGYGTADLEVSFKDEKYTTAQVLYADNELDLAVIMVSKRKIPDKAKAAKLECSDLRLNGREVAAFGHPEGLSYSASRGIISQVRSMTALTGSKQMPPSMAVTQEAH